MKPRATQVARVASLALALTLTSATPAAAHCDTTRGPVVTSARAALEAGNVNLVLHWVRPEDEAAIRTAFEQTMAVRGLGPKARELADRSFFETLVRIHRAGEGAPYTGLTEAEPEPIIAETDRALARGSAEELEHQLVRAVKARLAEKFAKAEAARSFQPGDVAGGRAFVAAYVPLTHWVEGVFAIANGPEGHHGSAATPPHGAPPHADASHAAPPHAAPPPAATHDDEHGASAIAPPIHPASHTFPLVPWLLAGLFAVAALIEGALLVRRTRSAQ